jgi:hypothetical protein
MRYSARNTIGIVCDSMGDRGVHTVPEAEQIDVVTRIVYRQPSITSSALATPKCPCTTVNA